MKRTLTIILAALAAPLHAHDLTFDECLEGSEFILHAAMSRDAGTSREEFVGRVQADLMAIQGFPPELRWFAQDAADEHFLVSASEAVFDNPTSAQAHQSDFLQACIGRMRTEARAPIPSTGDSDEPIQEVVKDSKL